MKKVLFSICTEIVVMYQHHEHHFRNFTQSKQWKVLKAAESGLLFVLGTLFEQSFCTTVFI